MAFGRAYDFGTPQGNGMTDILPQRATYPGRGRPPTGTGAGVDRDGGGREVRGRDKQSAGRDKQSAGRDKQSRPSGGWAD